MRAHIMKSITLLLAASTLQAQTVAVTGGKVYTVSGAPIPMELRLRTRRDQVRGTERALEATDILLTTAGGNSLKRGNPIERAWRDVHAGSVHVANDVERTLALYGRGAFGLAVEDNLV